MTYKNVTPITAGSATIPLEPQSALSPTAALAMDVCAQKDGTTFVSITESGFTGGDDELLKQVAASTQGFTLVLAGLKALHEHNVRLNLVADRFPKGLTEH
jgi:hypothetical protein